jgi:hypothetical protein
MVAKNEPNIRRIGVLLAVLDMYVLLTETEWD